MKMYIEFYASLMKYLPPGKSRFRREIDADESQILSRLIQRFHITEEEAHIVLVNGHFIYRENRDQHNLQEGDVVSIWPPVAGG
jgi:molybdopterin synthase sulfur carrier subunit